MGSPGSSYRPAWRPIPSPFSGYLLPGQACSSSTSAKIICAFYAAQAFSKSVNYTRCDGVAGDLPPSNNQLFNTCFHNGITKVIKYHFYSLL
ncbi:hypothetical protein AERO8C_90048 [Aeromonas veronii]|uniref:Uncharacterized protein n=1 Tax=Aeromonas veronii TaxID=654 RepID=A0A653LDI3_AERVE|nr:hypothetical protein AERO8C_90048 [Aeromonas veronii]